jgi:predicted membrane metal-binding protein
MRIGQTATTGSQPNRLPAKGTETMPAGEGRALVALSPAAAARRPSGSHRHAAFLAHLIATKGQLPQTRERRRAEPAEAIAAYRAGANLTDQ